MIIDVVWWYLMGYCEEDSGAVVKLESSASSPSPCHRSQLQTQQQPGAGGNKLNHNEKTVLFLILEIYWFYFKIVLICLQLYFFKQVVRSKTFSSIFSEILPMYKYEYFSKNRLWQIIFLLDIFMACVFCYGGSHLWL